MSTIIASNIPSSVEESKVKEFFSFCGKIDSIKQQDQESEGKSAYQVRFASAGAVSTALLLNGAELGGGEVHVIQLGVDKPLPLSEALPSYESANHEDIDQEEKPKSAILAQYLSQGYVVSDQLIEKALAFDKAHGYSEKFRNFVTSLDQKYHVQEKTTASAEQADTKFNIAENYNKGKMSLGDYFDKFKQDKYGSKIHQFYSGLVNDTKAVHDEARRLADLKEEKEKEKEEKEKDKVSV